MSGIAGYLAKLIFPEEPHQHFKKLILIAAMICIFMLFVVDSALFNEMSGVLATRPFEVYLFILTVSFLSVAAILLYPILAIHFRRNILLDEEIKRITAKYMAGSQEFQRRRAIEAATDPTRPGFDNIRNLKLIVNHMSEKHPEFAHIQLMLLDFIDSEVIDSAGRRSWDIGGLSPRTYSPIAEEAKKDYIRDKIYEAAWDSIEDTTYSFVSYVMPVSFCMLAVAFGVIVSFLIPFLGTSTIQFGNTSINLVWAAGGFLGAYIYSLYPLFQRYTRRDLPPRAFLDYAVRVFLGSVIVAILGNIFLSQLTQEGSIQFAGAALLGSMPNIFLSNAQEWIKQQLGWGGQEGIGNKDVSDIAGINPDYATRLHEEGIMNIQNLAFIDVEMISKRTMFHQNTLFDWKDKAILQLLTGDVLTHGFLESNTQPPPGTTTDPANKPKVYEALTEIGVSNITTLKNFLTSNNGAHGRDAEPLLKLLNWEVTNEAKHFLTSMCEVGEDMLGTPPEVGITISPFLPPGLRDREDMLESFFTRTLDEVEEISPKNKEVAIEVLMNASDRASIQAPPEIQAQLNRFNEEIAQRYASSLDSDQSRKELEQLAQQYITLRKEEPPGTPRTRKMTSVMRRMMALAHQTQLPAENYKEWTSLPKEERESVAGKVLWWLASAGVTKNVDYYEGVLWIIDGGSASAFEQYQALLTVEKMIPLLNNSQRMLLQQALENQRDYDESKCRWIKKETDRWWLSERLLSVIKRTR